MQTMRAALFFIAPVVALLMLWPVLFPENLLYARRMYTQSHSTSDPLVQQFGRQAHEETRKLIIYESVLGIVLVAVIFGIASTAKRSRARTI